MTCPKCFAGRPSPPESCPCGPFCPKGIPPSPNESVAQNKNVIPRILYDPGDFNISAASQALYGQEQGSATKSSITSIKWMGSSCPCVHSCARRCACWALVQISGTNAICRQLSGRNSKSSIAAKFTAEQGLFHRKILVNRSRPPSTAQTVSPPYRRHPFFNSSYNS